MDYFASFGLIVCFGVAPIVAKEFVTVGRDIIVKPTPNPLTDVSQRVDGLLNCIGSSYELSYYITNKVAWYHISSNGYKLQLTDGFFPADEARELFAGTDARYKLIYGRDDNGYKFDIKITGVTHSDNGIFQCMLLDDKKAVIDYKNVTITVVSPVQGVAIELRDMNHTVLFHSTVPLPNDATPMLTVPPGQYMIKCECYGSNPAPTMTVRYNDNTLNSTVVAVQSQLDNRVSYNASVSIRNQTLSPHWDIQIIRCYANIPGDFYSKMNSGFVIMVQNNQIETTPEFTTKVTPVVTTEVHNNTPSGFMSSADAVLSVLIIQLLKRMF